MLKKAKPKILSSFLFRFFILALFFLLSAQSFAEVISYDRALALKKDGQFEKAEHYFTELLKKDPQNAELWFQLGLTQRILQKREQAFLSQTKALEISPTNHDIRLELARLNHWKKESDVALTQVNEVIEAHPDYQDAIDLKETILRAKNAPKDISSLKWQFDLGYENSSFERRTQPNWHHVFFQAGYWFTKKNLVHLRVENTERVNTHNQHFEIGAVHLFNKTFSGFFSVGHTFDSLFIPKWRFKLGGEANLFFDQQFLDSLTFTLHTQHDRYSTLNTTVIKPGIKYRFLKNFQLQAQYIGVIDENNDNLHGWSTRLDWQTPLKQLRVFGGLADAPETENVQTVYTFSYFFGASFTIVPQVIVHASYARDDRENSFIRNILTTSLSLKF